MATPITNIPQGFLSLLGLRDMGGVPREVVSTITPGIDVIQFLLLNRDVETGSFSVSTVTSVAALTVPPGELWYVHHVHVESQVLAAGDAIAFTVGYRAGSTNVTISDPQSATAGTRAAAWAGGFWLPAGGVVSGRVMSITTAAGINCSASAIVTRLRI